MSFNVGQPVLVLLQLAAEPAWSYGPGWLSFLSRFTHVSVPVVRAVEELLPMYRGPPPRQKKKYVQHMEKSPVLFVLLNFVLGLWVFKQIDAKSSLIDVC